MRMQLSNQPKTSRRLTWMVIVLLLQRTPFLPWSKQVVTLFGSAVQQVWTWRIALPAITGTGAWHALTGATTFVTTSDTNPASGSEGDSFSFGFFTSGHKAFSYDVQDLPSGLSYNGDVNGPLISGDLPSAGTYTIQITGYRFAGLSGNPTPEYTLTLNVASAADTTAPVITLLGSSTVTVQLGDSYTDAGATATDDGDGDLTSSIVVGGDTVDVNAVGTYEITYDLTDSANNAATRVKRTVQVVEAGTLWVGGETTDLGNSWKESNWLGTLHDTGTGWIYHVEHGWLYVSGDDESALWLYDESLGWIYSGKNLYPNVYRQSQAGWLYYFQHDGTRYFWDYDNSGWASYPKN